MMGGSTDLDSRAVKTSKNHFKAGLFSLQILSVLILACDSSNPVAPVASTPATQVTYTVTLTSELGRLTVGSPLGTTITVAVRRNDNNQPPPDGTIVAINTSLGHFGIDQSNTPIRLVTRELFGGSAQVEMFAGTATGTARVLAELGDSTGSLNLPINAPGRPPVAKFSFIASANSLRVLFTDESTGSPVSYRWSFGDGRTSTERNPEHIYSRAGTYTVSLMVTNVDGLSDTFRNSVTVPRPGNPLQASFTHTINGLEVIFTDTSTGNPNSWMWEFGDGETSTRPNPVHTYPGVGTYVVNLTVTNRFNQRSGTRQVIEIKPASPLDADFTVETEVGGLTAVFTDTSTGDPVAWQWNFDAEGAGGATSTEQNPSHRYDQPGTYVVALTVTNSVGQTDTQRKSVTVPRGSALPEASFTTSIDGLRVLFTDTSTGSPTSWSWNFGDPESMERNTSTEQNPVHEFTKAGTYTVRLTVTNGSGSDMTAQNITVPEPGQLPMADFSFMTNGLMAVFADQSTGNPTMWEWNFGEPSSSMNTSMQQNPTHHYDEPGDYAVMLTVTNSSGSDTVNKIVTVGEAPAADFTCVNRGQRRVQFFDRSTGDPTQWQWSFGDGTTSTQKDPTHTYPNAATYVVTLTASNSFGSSTVRKRITVTEGPSSLPCDD